MKIAILYESLGRSRGGIEAWVYHAADALKKNKHNVIIVSSQRVIPVDAAPEGVEIINLLPLKYFPFDRSSFPVAINIQSYKSPLKNILRNVDIVWCRSPFMAYAASKILIDKKVVFIHAASYLIYSRSGFNQFKKTCPKNIINFIKILLGEINFVFIKRYELLALRSCINVYLSKSRKIETLEFYGLEDLANKFFVIPPGVDAQRFCPNDNVDNLDNILKLICVCRLVSDKNIQCVIKSLHLLKLKGLQRIHLAVVGEGPFEKELRELVSEYQLTKQVTFAGRQSNVEDWYNQAHVFVLPSLYEGFGSVYIEAMASGLPCIAIKSQHGKYSVATDEIIDNGVNGWLMSENSPKELSDIILNICNNPEQIKLYGAAARYKAVNVFSWGEVVEKMINLNKRS